VSARVHRIAAAAARGAEIELRQAPGKALGRRQFHDALLAQRREERHAGTDPKATVQRTDFPNALDVDLVFCTEIGTPLDPRNLNRSFRSLLIRAEVGVVLVEKDGEKRWVTGVRLHDLRHSCATFLLAQGASPRVLMEILGHSGIAVTMNTYAHVLPTLLGNAVTGMHRMFGLPEEDDDDS
jgi:integrase